MRLTSLLCLAVALAGCNDDGDTDTDESDTSAESEDSGDSGDSGDSKDSSDSGDSGGQAITVTGIFDVCDGDDPTDLVTSCGATLPNEYTYLADGGFYLNLADSVCVKMDRTEGQGAWYEDSCSTTTSLQTRYSWGPWELREQGGETYLVMEDIGDSSKARILKRSADAPTGWDQCEALGSVVDEQCTPPFESVTAPSIPVALAGDYQTCSGTDASDDTAIENSCQTFLGTYMDVNAVTNKWHERNVLPPCTEFDGHVTDLGGPDANLALIRVDGNEEHQNHYGVESREINAVQYLILDNSGTNVILKGGATYPPGLCGE